MWIPFALRYVLLWFGKATDRLRLTHCFAVVSLALGQSYDSPNATWNNSKRYTPSFKSLEANCTPNKTNAQQKRVHILWNIFHGCPDASDCFTASWCDIYLGCVTDYWRPANLKHRGSLHCESGLTRVYPCSPHPKKIENAEWRVWEWYIDIISSNVLFDSNNNTAESTPDGLPFYHCTDVAWASRGLG